MHYSDDETPRRARRPRDDQDELASRRRAAPQPAGDAGDDDDLVGPRRGGAPRSAARDADGADDDGGDDLVGPRRGARRRTILDDEEEAADAPRPAAPRLRRGGRERGGLSRETLIAMVRDVPSFIKLFGRLATDARVSKVDKAIVAAVLVYLVSPVDLVPDWVVPVVGQIEDVYLLALALSRLVNNAGVEVLMDHWDGDTSTLEAALAALDRAGRVLPGPVQAILGKRR